MLPEHIRVLAMEFGLSEKEVEDTFLKAAVLSGSVPQDTIMEVARNLLRISTSKPNRSERQQKKLDKLRKEKDAAAAPKEESKPVEESDDDEGSFKDGAPEWWTSMTHKQQLAYLDEHPNSQMSKQLDDHLQKSIEKKHKEGKLSDKEKEVAQRHYSAKQREKDSNTDETQDDDELVERDKEEKDTKKKTKVSLKDNEDDLSLEEDSEDEEEDNPWTGEDEKNEKSSGSPELDDLFKKDETHSSRLSSLKDDPNSDTAKKVDRYLSKTRKARDLTEKERDMAKAIEEGRKIVKMSPSEKKAYLADKKVERAKELGRSTEQGRAMLDSLKEDQKKWSKKDHEAWKKLQKAKPKNLNTKEKGIFANVVKAFKGDVQSKIADPEHCYHSLAKLKSGEDLTELDRTNVKRAMLKVGAAVLITAAIAGLVFVAAPMVPGLIDSYLKNRASSDGDGYSVFSSDDSEKDKPTEKEQNDLIGGMAEDFAKWLTDQDLTSVEKE